jgi:hypothetical protein
MWLAWLGSRYGMRALELWQREVTDERRLGCDAQLSVCIMVECLIYSWKALDKRVLGA